MEMESLLPPPCRRSARHRQVANRKPSAPSSRRPRISRNRDDRCPGLLPRSSRGPKAKWASAYDRGVPDFSPFFSQKGIKSSNVRWFPHRCEAVARTPFANQPHFGFQVLRTPSVRFCSGVTALRGVACADGTMPLTSWHAAEGPGAHSGSGTRGFVNPGGKGSHRNYFHASGVPITISGNSGDDAKPYQEKELAKKLGMVKT